MKAIFPKINTSSDLIESIVAFNRNPELHREILRTNPRYFAFFRHRGKLLFGLSKFVVFKNIDAYDYIQKARKTTWGGNTQKIISRRMRQEWKLEKTFSLVVQQEFRKWIIAVNENFAQHEFYLMEIKASRKVQRKLHRGRSVTPETLLKKLQRQQKIGVVGEQIAIQYEIDRLQSLGCLNPKKFVQHVSKKNIAAGYDILSTFAEDRYIEVKATTRSTLQFYISPQELYFMKLFKEKCYLYMVYITDEKLRKGRVRVIEQPHKWLGKNTKMLPQLFKVTPIKQEAWT